MSDRTPLSVCIHACPPHRVRAVLHVFDENAFGLELVGDLPTGEGRLVLQMPYVGAEVPCGTSDEVAAALINVAPESTFTVWEDPKDEWLGTVHRYTPTLGHFTAQCDARGDTQLNVSTYRARVEVSKERVGQALGIPWLDEIDLLPQEPQSVAAPDAAPEPAVRTVCTAYPAGGAVTPRDLAGLTEWFDGDGVMRDGADIDAIRHDNTRRAGFAAKALCAHAHSCGDDLVDTALSDLIADLHHLVDALGHSWADHVAAAERCYVDELHGRP